MHGWIFDIERTANNANNGIEHLLHIFFEVTETSPASAASTFSGPSVGWREPTCQFAELVKEFLSAG